VAREEAPETSARALLAIAKASLERFAIMADKEKIDLEIRLAAIEYVLINVTKAVYLTAGVPSDKMREMREGARTRLMAETFPDLDPSMGDHVGAELADRVEYLLGEIEKLVADANRQLGR
jgi:hypothetical protein